MRGTNEDGSFAEQFSFLDIEKGMTYCSNDEAFYREMLESYCKDTRLEEIQNSYDAKDWGNYRILVHALKSSSIVIGAVDLSGQAKELETAAGEEDVDFIAGHHDDCMNVYREILERITDALEKSGGADAEREDPPQQEEPLPEYSEHILVVDDDAVNQKVAAKLLAEKYQVSCVRSGQEALEFLQENLPDLILLDLHMQGMDGFDVLAHVKEDKRTEGIPVIFLTADDNQEVEILGFEAGVSDYIRKPFVAKIMIRRVQRILELSRLQRDLRREVERQTSKAEERRKKVEQMALQMVYTLVSAIDAKDKYTDGHSSRVAEYSVYLAKALGYSEEQLINLRHIALLHDIGKISIPDSVLNKQGKLTDTEYEVMKSHTVAGGGILDNISTLPDIRIGARYHHERYDGRGYPDGLKGEDIPEVARIISIADAYDAMNSKRVYRNRLPRKVIREEFVRGRGTQFDPHMTDVFLRLFDEHKLGERAEGENTDAKGLNFLLQEVFSSEGQDGEQERDSLTGLMLRLEGERAISEAIQREGGCLCFVDVDNLKKINDTQGHLTGDHLLSEIGDVLKKYEKGNIICRLGGDEFLVYIPKAGELEAVGIVEGIMQMFEEKKKDTPSMQGSSLSVGICLCPKGADYREMLSNADKALYYVKQNGKADYYIYAQGKEAVRTTHSEDMKELIEGIENGGRYSGALDVEYRTFTKVYEYLKNLDKRYAHETTLALISLDAKRGTDVAEREKAMNCMEESIRSTIRTTDVFSRYSSMQFLVILVQAGTESTIKSILNRIVKSYMKFYGSMDISVSYEFASMARKETEDADSAG